MADLLVCFVADEQYQLPAGGVVECLSRAQPGLCVQPPLYNQWLSIYKEPFQTCTLGDVLGDHILLYGLYTYALGTVSLSWGTCEGA